jgi:metallo-beta-lactamase class B
MRGMMKKIMPICFSLLLIGTAVGPVSARAALGKLPAHTNQSIANEDGTIVLTPLSNHVWIHTEYTNLGGVMFPSNGLLILTSKGIVMVGHVMGRAVDSGIDGHDWR